MAGTVEELGGHRAVAEHVGVAELVNRHELRRERDAAVVALAQLSVDGDLHHGHLRALSSRAGGMVTTRRSTWG